MPMEYEQKINLKNKVELAEQYRERLCEFELYIIDDKDC